MADEDIKRALETLKQMGERPPEGYQPPVMHPHDAELFAAASDIRRVETISIMGRPVTVIFRRQPHVPVRFNVLPEEKDTQDGE
jgi:hypothetical protein